MQRNGGCFATRGIRCFYSIGSFAPKHKTAVIAEEKSGRVLINDKPAKASANVKAGDIITIQFGNKDVKVEVLDVQETVRKENAGELFKYL